MSVCKVSSQDGFDPKMYLAFMNFIFQLSFGQVWWIWKNQRLWMKKSEQYNIFVTDLSGTWVVLQNSFFSEYNNSPTELLEWSCELELSLLDALKGIKKQCPCNEIKILAPNPQVSLKKLSQLWLIMQRKDAKAYAFDIS